jgi:crotonobetainyl-CoA:carnitine CoA-transferase CaiB-like acyl-CoA transferase
MGEPEWLTDPRFSTDPLRGEHGALISERMGRWCAERTTENALEILGQAMIPAGPVLSPQQALDDPHVNALGFLQPVDFPGLPKPAPLSRVPVYLSDSPGSIRHRAPRLGEHTDMILSEIGYSSEDIISLRQSGAV